MTLALSHVAYAEANWSKWIARCPRPWCTNAMPLERGQLVMRCEGPDSCGAAAEIVWPADPDAIELLLSMRPVPRTRNWLPGESLDDLVIENAVHDLLPPQWSELAAAAGGVLPIIRTVDDRVVGGLLMAQLESVRRREIEGA